MIAFYWNDANIIDDIECVLIITYFFIFYENIRLTIQHHIRPCVGCYMIVYVQLWNRVPDFNETDYELHVTENHLRLKSYRQ